MSDHLEQSVPLQVEEDEFFEAKDDLNHLESSVKEPNSESETVGEDDEDFVEAVSEHKVAVDSSEDEGDENQMLKELVISEEAIEELKSVSNALKLEGNQAFKEERFNDAIELYTKALKSCPKRVSRGAVRSLQQSSNCKSTIFEWNSIWEWKSWFKWWKEERISERN